MAVHVFLEVARYIPCWKEAIIDIAWLWGLDRRIGEPGHTQGRLCPECIVITL
jgi:hypothetical protein